MGKQTLLAEKLNLEMHFQAGEEDTAAQLQALPVPRSVSGTQAPQFWGAAPSCEALGELEGSVTSELNVMK